MPKVVSVDISCMLILVQETTVGLLLLYMYIHFGSVVDFLESKICYSVIIIYTHILCASFVCVIYANADQFHFHLIHVFSTSVLWYSVNDGNDSRSENRFS